MSVPYSQHFYEFITSYAFFFFLTVIPLDLQEEMETDTWRVKNQFKLHFEANRIRLLHKTKLQKTVLNPGFVSHHGSTYKHTTTPRQECVLHNFSYI